MSWGEWLLGSVCGRDYLTASRPLGGGWGENQQCFRGLGALAAWVIYLIGVNKSEWVTGPGRDGVRRSAAPPALHIGVQGRARFQPGNCSSCERLVTIAGLGARKDPRPSRDKSGTTFQESRPLFSGDFGDLEPGSIPAASTTQHHRVARPHPLATPKPRAAQSLPKRTSGHSRAGWP